MPKSTLKLLLPSLLLATTLAACGDKAADASAAGSAPQSKSAADAPTAGSAPRAKSFNVTARATNDAADEEEIKRFRLTMDGVRKFHAINLAMEKLDLDKASQASGTAKDSAAAEKESDTGSNSPSLDELETSINSNKQARALIAAQGMDTREYVVMAGALFVVAAAQMAIDLGAKPDAVAKEFDAEKVQFYKEHRKELDAMQKMSNSK